ncbi:hypothetical protein IJT10_08640 [bacterium]|nr:hypothetical protein [bacterium]
MAVLPIEYRTVKINFLPDLCHVSDSEESYFGESQVENNVDVVDDITDQRLLLTLREIIHDDRYCSEEMFAPQLGCWKLWPYRDFTKDNLPKDEKWLDVSALKPGIYASDPRASVVPGGQWAAIDFGFDRTTVAVIVEGGYQLVKLSLPTIFRSKDIDSDVTSELSIKEWADDPNRVTWLPNKDGERFDLQFNAQGEKSIDPIENYAYYIGCRLNNVSERKIYLQYLLSFSANFVQQNVEEIRQSFERGLKNSLPSTFVEDEELMKRFEVKLHLDEGTAYAVSAFRSYYTEATKNGNAQQYDEELNSDTGLFYGTYNFGARSLDFSFGVIVNKL